MNGINEVYTIAEIEQTVGLVVGILRENLIYSLFRTVKQATSRATIRD